MKLRGDEMKEIVKRINGALTNYAMRLHYSTVQKIHCLMAKIKLIQYLDRKTGEKYHHDQYHYWCPGCGYVHAFALKPVGGHHDFNGDLDNPTVSPSLVQNFTPGKMCHSFIENGQIRFLDDCTHSLAGQTVELPDVDKMIEEGKKRIH